MSDTASPPAPPRPEGDKPDTPAAAPKAVQAEARVVADSAPKAPDPVPSPPPAPVVVEPPDPGTPTPAPAPVAAPAAAPAPSRIASRLRRLVAVVGTILILFVGWEVLTWYIAYTDDAYVRSDLIGVAPEVTGPIIGLYVVDNQAIKKGDRIYKIDPTPFQLEVNTRQAQIEEQTALVKVAQEELQTSQAALESATSAHTYAVEQQARYAVLAADNNAPRSELDRANNELRRTAAEKTIAEIAIAKARTSISVHKAALDTATAEKATAEWKLDKTNVVAPADGWINNLTVRIGDTATISIPNVGIVDAHAWRIIANYKEYYVRPFTIDGTAWVWLDSDPWRFHKARITGIARGFSRSQEPPMLLPYVAPTTDWIRLQRRIPVTIVLDEPPPDGKLYMGADARTVVFPR